MMYKILNTIFIALLVIRNNIAKQCESPIHTCNRDKISFYLYNEKTHPHHEELILGNEASIKNASFIPKVDVKFIIHGYKGSKDAPPCMVDLRNEYLKQKKFNILVVDWGPLAINGCYLDLAIPSIPLVGRCSAEMVKAILKYRPEIKEDQFHIVSWSLGAHVAAQFGNHFKPRLISRITGLEPALPKFDSIISTEPENILNRNHAKFVDVFHTNVGVVGVWFSNGTYDIYFNNGAQQPGCTIYRVPDARCDHRRAVEFFTESINSKTKFIAKRCDSNSAFLSTGICTGDSKIQIEVGERCLPPKKHEHAGTYQLDTNDDPPYAKGYYHCD